MVVVKLRLFTVVFAVLLIVGCAPWTPAPVEDRSRAAGQEPERSQPSAPSRSEPRVVAPAPATYQVRRGDTLYSIAFRYDIDWRNIARWNGIDAPYTIRPGQELRLIQPPSTESRPAANRTAESAPVAEQPAAATEPEPKPSPRLAESTRAVTPEPATESRAPGPEPSRAGPSRSVGGVEWQWPTSGSVTRPFDAAAIRRGIGIAGSAGQPVYAGAAGEVVYSGTALIGYGELIIIKHSDTLLSAYGHNRRRLVSEGDRVQRGQQIAELGLNDRNEEMLHFEIRRSGQPVNPLEYLPRR